MTTARKQLVIPGQPGFYHCISRCVRRAYLCGTDKYSGRNFDHRRDWMVERMRMLTTCFALDIYAYAFLDNHYHIVIYVDPERVDCWSDEQVVKQWKTLWNWRRPSEHPVLPKKVSSEKIKEWRRRLSDVSWVMRLLNEPIARIANAEDDVTGHFWESRFKCTPLLDDASLIACMVYVDLNPIKAGVALTLEGSEYTSIQKRIRELQERNTEADSGSRQRDVSSSTVKNDILRPIASACPDRAPVVSLSEHAYLDLVQVTAESFQLKQEMGSLNSLHALGIRPTGWQRAVTEFLVLFRSAAGAEAVYSEFMHQTDRKRRQDAAARRALFT